jgi:hypothetical protein
MRPQLLCRLASLYWTRQKGDDALDRYQVLEPNLIPERVPESAVEALGASVLGGMLSSIRVCFMPPLGLVQKRPVEKFSLYFLL